MGQLLTFQGAIELVRFVPEAVVAQSQSSINLDREAAVDFVC